MFTRLISAATLALLVQIPAWAGSVSSSRIETAILAGGCFWCMESDYEKLDGVLDVVSGYTGGHVSNPTYEQVSSGGTGHLEAVKVTYDASRISYPQILDFFWHHIDPTRNDGQFCDRGPQYRPAIFYEDESQHQQALASEKHIEQIKPFAEPLKVEIIQASKFYPAEQYHQDYYKKNPLRYRFYRYTCGRDSRIDALWGKS
jgi:peptide-methionine (S)-S-oxide reductase